MFIVNTTAIEVMFPYKSLCSGRLGFMLHIKLLQLGCLYKQIGFPWLQAQLEALSVPCCGTQLLDFKEQMQVPRGQPAVLQCHWEVEASMSLLSIRRNCRTCFPSFVKSMWVQGSVGSEKGIHRPIFNRARWVSWGSLCTTLLNFSNLDAG